ncbi:MAG: glycosyltransferase family 39 protein [Pseudomonadota bacterium]
MIKRVTAPVGVAAVVLCYCLIHTLALLAPGPTLALDDVKLNVLTQSLEGGYLPTNPPLYEWTLIAAQTIAGPTLISAAIAKYSLLSVMLLGVFAASRNIGVNRLGAALVVLSTLALFQFGWNLHQAFTHTTALLAATGLLLASTAALINKREPWAYALLGIACGAGLVAKYSFVLIALCLFLAMCLRREGRYALASPWMMLTLTFGVVIVSPHASWLLNQDTSLGAAAAGRLEAGATPYILRAAKGVASSVGVIATFFLPTLLFALVAFGPSTLRQGALGTRSRTASLSEADKASLSAGALMFRDAALLGAAVLVIGVLAVGAPKLQDRYAVGFLLPAVIWLGAAIAQVRPSQRAVHRYAFLISAVVVAFTGGRFVQAVVAGAPFCSTCRQWTPFDALGEEMKAAGVDATGTITGYTDNTAGNLRRLFPKTRVVSAHQQIYAPPIGKDKSTSCVFVWSGEMGAPEPAQVVAKIPPAKIIEVTADWRHPLRGGNWRQTTWRYADISDMPELASGICRLNTR